MVNVQPIRFSFGAPPRAFELRFSSWGMESYWVDGALLARRWSLSSEGQREFTLGGSRVRVEMVKHPDGRVVRAFVDGELAHEQLAEWGRAQPRKSSFWRPTLTECLIAAVILGVLAATAVPPSDKSYHLIFTIRDDLKRFDEVKPRIAEFRAAKGEWPARKEDVGIPADGLLPESRYPLDLYADGGVTLRLWRSCSGQADCSPAGRRELGFLSLRPAVNDQGNIVWLCGATGVPPGYKSVARNRTSAPRSVLPGECE